MMSQTTPECVKHSARGSISLATARTHQLKASEHPTPTWRWVYVRLTRVEQQIQVRQVHIPVCAEHILSSNILHRRLTSHAYKSADVTYCPTAADLICLQTDVTL